MTSESEPGAQSDAVLEDGLEDPLRYVAKDLATTVLLLGGAVGVEKVKDLVTLPALVLAALNISEITLVVFLVGILVRTARIVVRQWQELLATVRASGPVGAVGRFLRAFVPDPGELTRGFKLGIACGFFILLFVALSLASASSPLLVPLGVMLTAFVVAAIYLAALWDELDDSGGGVVIMFVIFLVVAFAIPVVVGLALWATGGTDTVLSLFRDVLQRE